MDKTTRRLSPAMDSFLYAKDEKIHTEAETALPTRRRRRSISPMPTDLKTTSRNKGQWRVTKSLLQALAFLLIENQEELDSSLFQEFIDNNEFGLALDELAAVVNHQGEDVINAER